MATPTYNFKQVLIRSFKPLVDAIRVCVVNTASNPVPVEIVDGSFTDDTTVTMFNIALGPVNTEQSQALPADTKSFLIKSRNNAVLKLAYTAAQSGTKYIEIKKHAVFTDDNKYAAQTLYFQSSQTGDVVEIVAYV